MSIVIKSTIIFVLISCTIIFLQTIQANEITNVVTIEELK